MIQGLRPRDLPVGDTFFFTWKTCVLESISSSFVISLEQHLAPLCKDTGVHHLTMLRSLTQRGALRRDTWALEDGLLPGGATLRAFNVPRGARVLRLKDAIKGTGYIVLIKGLLKRPGTGAGGGFGTILEQPRTGAGRKFATVSDEQFDPVEFRARRGGGWGLCLCSMRTG